MDLLRAAIADGLLRYSDHANQRMRERWIIRPEVEFVLRFGHHNKRKDQFNEEHKDWDYAIEGKTVDGRRLRIVVAVVSPNVLVVTAIDLVL